MATSAYEECNTPPNARRRHKRASPPPPGGPSDSEVPRAPRLGDRAYCLVVATAPTANDPYNSEPPPSATPPQLKRKKHPLNNVFKATPIAALTLTYYSIYCRTARLLLSSSTTQCIINKGQRFIEANVGGGLIFSVMWRLEGTVGTGLVMRRPDGGLN